MSVKFICISDTHMSNKLPYAKIVGDGVTDRLQDQIALWKNVGETAATHNVDAIFVLGDLFDKSIVDAVTLAHTVEPIVNLDVPVFILPGNHDANSVHGGRFISEVFRAMGKPDVTFMDGKENIGIGEVVFWPVPFCNTSEAERIIEKARGELDPERNNVLLLHHSIIGCSHLGWVCDDGLEPDFVCDGFDLVLSGHFHNSQEFGDCGLYLGAPLHHHYGDVGRESQYWVVDFLDGEIEMEPISTNDIMPCFHLASGLDETGELKSGDYLRYEVESTKADWIKQKQAYVEACDKWNAQGVNATYKHKPVYHHKARLVTGDSGAAPASIDEMLGMYVESLGIVVGDLDAKKLKRIGKETLEMVRRTDEVS